MDIVYKECKKMIQEIATELDARGLTIELEEKSSEPLQKETIETISKQYMSYALEESDKVASIRSELPKHAADNRDNPDLLCVIKEQKYCIDRQESAIEEIQNGVKKLQGADTNEQQNTVINDLEAAKRRSETEKNKFAELSQSFKEISSQSKQSLREQFYQSPRETLDNMVADYPRLGELSDFQLAYIAKSNYIEENLVPLLKNYPDKFVDEVCSRAESLENIVSKKGCFVEINTCEQWTDIPIVKEGALMHPKVAEDIIKQGEKQIRRLKAEAEKKGEYFPYNKCNITVFTKNGQFLSGYNTRVDLGDKNQESLSGHLSKVCRNSTVVDDFTRATREKNAWEKISFNDVTTEPIEVQEDIKNVTETLENWESAILNEKKAEQDKSREKNPAREKDMKENAIR